jgi:coenzyme F420-reducing hydrogenase delta subunit
MYGLWSVCAGLKRYTEAAEKLKKQGVSPLVLVFVCQWSEFRALDQMENMLSRKMVLMMEVPCFKALDPVHAINALENGFDGVMAAVCPPEDCKLQEGQETAERNITVLKNALKTMSLLERFELFTVHPRCVGEFEQKLDGFRKRIACLPPLRTQAQEVKAHV